MACIKGVNKSATAAFAPNAPYLAAGTMAGAVDLTFSSVANLDVFQLDFTSDDHNLIHSGTTTSSEKFSRLSWGKPLPNSDEFSLGIIAGGLGDGTVSLWNPKQLISSQSSEKAFIGNLSKHKGPVRGLEFNAITPNLLASGADEGEICIWDITKPTEPIHPPPLKGSGSATQSEISFLSWNSKVQNILASTSYNGTTVVWDLKKQKPVLSFADSTRRRCSVLQWNPDAVTQLIVASDEDDSPALRLWDMRNIMAPVKEFVGHTKGVIAMSWCPIDSSYLLTCAKDNRTICWDTVSGEIVSELPAGTNWNFDVHWYPKIPGVISASSFDGKIGIYNIEGCGLQGEGDNNFRAAPLRAPKWYKRKAGVSFGFGGKLISFHSTEVYVHNLATEHGVVTHSSEFEAAIKNGERDSLKLLCEKKNQESESESERETWGFLKVMLEDDARTKLLSHLGFKRNEEKNDISDQINVEENVATNTEKDVSNEESNVFPIDNGEEFFNNLPSPKTDTPVSISGHDNNIVVADEEEELLESESDDPSFDECVQNALLVGDYKRAVSQCISANKWSDALVIAHVSGSHSSLWLNTRDQYLNSTKSPYLKIVSALVKDDFTSLINTRPLSSWKETLALFCTFAQQDQWMNLCNALASRLMSANNTLAATLCYICASNIDKTIEIWSKSLGSGSNGTSYVDLLKDLMEKTIVFALATGQKRFSASLCKLVEKYAEILASQGQLNTAMEFLKLLGTEELSPELKILRDRISQSILPEIDTAKPEVYDNSQYQTGPTYGADHHHQSSFGAVDASQQHYYQEATPVQNSPYVENYQRQPQQQYVMGYNNNNNNNPSVGPTYQQQQQQPQPNIFLPSPAPQFPHQNFNPPPPQPPAATAQPPVTPFIPANPPTLKNVEQYQQPITLGSQLYPNHSFQTSPPTPTTTTTPGPGSFGPGPNSSHQVGPPSGQMMPPQGVAAPRGFMPGVNQMQSPTPVQTPISPPAPPPTVQTADTSNVPAHQKPVIATLTRLFDETSEALGGSRANPSKKREIDDNSKKLGALFAKLNSGDISKNAAEKLIQLCQSLANGDFSTALQIQVLLTTSDWDECNFWLATVKRMIKTRQSFR